MALREDVMLEIQNLLRIAASTRPATPPAILAVLDFLAPLTRRRVFPPVPTKASPPVRPQ